MSCFGFNEHEDYAQYAKYLATPTISVSTEIIQCMKLILENQNMPCEEGRFIDKLP